MSNLGDIPHYNGAGHIFIIRQSIFMRYSNLFLIGSIIFKLSVCICLSASSIITYTIAEKVVNTKCSQVPWMIDRSVGLNFRSVWKIG